jgi:hypothetical protein
MKTAMIGNRVEAVLEFDVEKIERDNGIVSVAGWVEVDGKRRYVSAPLALCEEAPEIGNGGEEVQRINPEQGRVER